MRQEGDVSFQSRRYVADIVMTVLEHSDVNGVWGETNGSVAEGRPSDISLVRVNVENVVFQNGSQYKTLVQRS